MAERDSSYFSQRNIRNMDVPSLSSGAVMTRRGFLGRFAAGVAAAGTLVALDAACSSTTPSSSPVVKESTGTPEIIVPHWSIRSGDSMKQSRDDAQAILQGFQENPELTQHLIDLEVQDIANLNTTHVAIGTPYDDEFLPVAKAYIASARKHGLNIWWRGNFSEFEIQNKDNPNIGWFNYPHNPNFMEQPGRIKQFVAQNGYLFQPGDIFTPWPEPENIINPYERKNDYQNLLLADYQAAKPLQGRGVRTGYFSMNGDVATIIDPGVVQALDNVVVIDHYVPPQGQAHLMGDKIRQLHALYPGAQVVVGEFGGPDVDPNNPSQSIDPPMNDQEQAVFITELFEQMIKGGVMGMNYWTILEKIDGSADPTISTELMDSPTKPRPSYYVVQKYFGASARSKT